MTDIDVNLADPDLLLKGSGPPFGMLKRWRESDPVHWNPVPEGYLNPNPQFQMTKGCQSASKKDPLSASKRDPSVERRDGHDGRAVRAACGVGRA